LNPFKYPKFEGKQSFSRGGATKTIGLAVGFDLGHYINPIKEEEHAGKENKSQLSDISAKTESHWIW
jgi:hypothetical protein